MQTRLVAALFETGAEARLAADDAAAAGIDRRAVSLATDDAGLDGLLLPEADRRACAEGLRRGGAFVAVRVEDARVDQVARVLEEAGAVDLDERERAWSDAGWRGGEIPSDDAPGEGPPRLLPWRAAGHGTGRVRAYTAADDTSLDDDRTVGDPDADRMGLNMSHPARHGGL